MTASSKMKKVSGMFDIYSRGERGALIIVVRRSWVGSNRKRSYDSRLAIVVRCTLDTICWTYLEKRGKSRLRYLESPGDCPTDVAMKIVCEKKLDESCIDEGENLKNWNFSPFFFSSGYK